MPGTDNARQRRAIAAAIAILVSITVSLHGQRSITRSIYVSAIDVIGRPVLDLRPADFEITESGSKREVTGATLGTAPMRIVLMVDSSTPVGPMVNTFKKALAVFVDTLPPQHEVAFISSGSQIRVRTRPGDGRDKLRAEMARFSSEGGANAFLDTLLEADTRFLKTAPGQWPVFVIVTTDNGDARKEPDVVSYNKFMNDFVARGGAAHALIIVGKQTAPVTDLVSNLVDNVQGFRQTLNTDNSLPERMREIAERLDIDHRTMMNRYQVTYAGDPAVTAPFVNITTSRDDVRLQMSARRPF
ncbi:MAG TPA: hypothetical protein VFZ38_11145 [Vicinamibacterales bacterium]